MPRTTPLLWLLPLCALWACRAPAPAAPPLPRGAWPYWPDAMRLHPLTRLAPDPFTRETVIEARVEFVDAERVTTRAAGVVHLKLHDASSEGLLNEWIVDLEDRQQNTLHFDTVTRTYLFKLQVDPATLPAEVLLRASFHGADGRDFEASAPLRRPG